MHVHVPGRRERQTGALAETPETREAPPIVATTEPFGRDPRTPGEMLRDPVRPGTRHAGFLRLVFRQPQRETAVQIALEIGHRQPVAALVRGPASPGDEPGEPAVGGPVRGQQHQAETLFQPQLGADDQREIAFPGRRVGTHHARQGALVGDGDGGVAELRGPQHQLLRVGGAAEKAEIGDRVQLGVTGLCSCRHGLILESIRRLYLYTVFGIHSSVTADSLSPAPRAAMFL